MPYRLLLDDSLGGVLSPLSQRAPPLGRRFFRFLDYQQDLALQLRRSHASSTLHLVLGTDLIVVAHREPAFGRSNDVRQCRTSLAWPQVGTIEVSRYSVKALQLAEAAPTRLDAMLHLAALALMARVYRARSAHSAFQSLAYGCGCERACSLGISILIRF